MLKSSLCACNDAYILVEGAKSVENTTTADAVANSTNWKAIFKTCAPFKIYITEINNIVMLWYQCLI